MGRAADAGVRIEGAGGLGLRLALFSVAIALAAVNTGNNLLYLMLSLVLGLGVISLIASGWSLRRLDVQVMLPGEAVRGEPFLAAVEATGRFPFLPQTWLDVELKGLPAPVRMSVALPSRSGRGVASSWVTLPERGVYEGLTATTATVYPLGLARRRRGLGWRGRLVVLPSFTRIRRVRVLCSPGQRRGGVNTPSSRGIGAGADLYNIRQYGPHDDARHIDWRSSARAGRLMVREFEREEERRLDLVLDLRGGEGAAFEAAIERCASIIDLARRETFDARLLVPGLDRALAGDEAMTYLAGARPVTDASLGEALARTRRDGELVVISADPGCCTPVELS